jgi:hypothetical protein
MVTGYEKSQLMRRISLFIWLPIVFSYAICSMIEHYNRNLLYLGITVYIFIDSLWTLVYTISNFIATRVGHPDPNTFTYIRLYDVFIEGPIYIWFGLTMMSYYQTAGMFYGSLFIALYGLGSLIYNGYNHASHYIPLKPINIAGFELST